MSNLGPVSREPDYGDYSSYETARNMPAGPSLSDAPPAPAPSRLADAAHALDFAGAEASRALDPAGAQARDAAAITALSSAIERHDEPAVAEVLRHADATLMAKIWAADLPAWVPPDQALETLKTAPGDAWRVNWAFGFDPKTAGDALSSRWIPGARPALDWLNVIRKEFPADRQQGGDHLDGVSTQGYTPGVPESGADYPAYVRMADTPDGQGGTTRAAVLTYEAPPWFSKETGVGLRDQFKVLTPNIVVARMAAAEYGEEDLHGAAAAPRPPLSAIASALAGGRTANAPAPPLPFWMYRFDKSDASETPKFS